MYVINVRFGMLLILEKKDHDPWRQKNQCVEAQKEAMKGL
jgi:hypothetical protein